MMKKRMTSTSVPFTLPFDMLFFVEGITTVDKLLFNISETHYYKCGGRHGQKVQLEKQTSTQEGEHIENTLETETDMRSTWQNNRPQI